MVPAGLTRMIENLILQLILQHVKKKAAELQASKEIGSYQTPAYLKDAAVGSEHGTRLTAPVKTPNPSESALPGGKLGSVVPTPITFKKDLTSPSPVPVIATCSFCNGLVKDGECGACGGRQCPSCGEMNYATATSCLSCKRTF